MARHPRRRTTSAEKSGFTIIEVMLVLAISGMLLIGVIGGTFSSIAAQRYNDSLRGFAEYLRSVYSEVISPQSLGSSDPDTLVIGNSTDSAVLGKVLVFGYNYGDYQDDHSVYAATLIGKADIPHTAPASFIEELADPELDVQLFCGDSIRNSTVTSYVPLWETELMQANNADLGTSYNNPFRGTIIIARSPSSGAVHTIYARDFYNYNLRDNCRSDDSAAANTLNTSFKEDLQQHSDQYNISDPIEICLKPTTTSVRREIRINADGRNTSAVNTLTEGESQCQ